MRGGGTAPALKRSLKKQAFSAQQRARGWKIRPFSPHPAPTLVDSALRSGFLVPQHQGRTPSLDHKFSAINIAKANFNDIYTAEDPRDYFSVLGALDYMIPDVAEPVVRQILEARSRIYKDPPVVLDVGCSYGINAAVHRFPLGFNTLRRRYARREVMGVDSTRLLQMDKHYYQAWPETGLARFIGLDIAEPAISYACKVGLLEAGITANLEDEALSREDAAIIARSNVILATGCVGYVTEKTYRQILDAMPRPPWVISFVLRMFPYDPLAAALEKHGLVTEKLAGATFVQRRFRDVDEFQHCLDAVQARGLSTSGFESDGLFQADLFVSRPKADARAAPLEEMVTVNSGRNRPVGPRYVQVETGDGTHIALEPGTSGP
jgi:hypothetical protein